MTAETPAPEPIEPAADPVEETQDEATEPIEGEEALGDPGKKALDAMKAKERAARQRAQAAEEERDRLKAAAEGREAEWEAERKADTEREQRFRNKYLKAEIKAAAKGVLSDPDDAFRFLDLDEFEVSDDGDVDAEAISSALASLTESKPYLAVQDGRRFNGSSDSGARNASHQQVTEAQLEAMSPAEINKARREGRLDHLLGKN